ncbi:hypothetical protein B0H17DRAFT_1132601 [Mycena rosella]|uniref:Uncharacterized protein n=1 Tax=Mycena rosella TaxID=1033263 RepID=A0AAD7DKM0_MYCRO|nr:hypothetical protein B0H17DRAFT_1132601 [Mycena rosella]
MAGCLRLPCSKENLESVLGNLGVHLAQIYEFLESRVKPSALATYHLSERRPKSINLLRCLPAKSATALKVTSTPAPICLAKPNPRYTSAPSQPAAAAIHPPPRYRCASEENPTLSDSPQF